MERHNEGLHSGLILREAFSPCFMLFRATGKAFRGCPLPTCTTAPSSGEATTAVLLPVARTAYFTAGNRYLQRPQDMLKCMYVLKSRL